MVDGVALMTGLLHGFRAAGVWNDVPGTNLLDSGAHFYEVYERATAATWRWRRSSRSSTTSCLLLWD